MIVFTGYSDDVVLSGSCKSNLDEYYSKHYLLEDGTEVRAEFTRKGWEFECSNPNHFIIEGVDPDDKGISHTDERIPDWIDPQGHSAVLIIDTDSPIVAQSDNKFRKNAIDDVKIMIFASAVNKAMRIDDDEGITVDAIKTALSQTKNVIQPI